MDRGDRTIPRSRNLADFGFQLRNRGSQDAVRTACTAICAEALLDKKDRNEAEEQALQNAIKELLKVRKFAFHPGESFCTWGYGYKLGFLSRLVSSEEGAGMEEEIRKSAQSCVRWPGEVSTARRWLGLLLRSSAGFRLDVVQHGVLCAEPASRCQNGARRARGLVKDAAKIVERQKVPDGSYVYSSSHRKNPGSMLKNLGADRARFRPCWRCTN